MYVYSKVSNVIEKDTDLCIFYSDIHTEIHNRLKIVQVEKDLCMVNECMSPFGTRVGLYETAILTSTNFSPVPLTGVIVGSFY